MSILEEAIVDAKALKEAALKNAESLVVEKFSNKIKEAVNNILEQGEDELEMGLEDEIGLPGDEEVEGTSDVVDQIPLSATDDELCCKEEDEEIEIDFGELKKHWNDVKNAKTNKEKKDTLEGLAEFLFNSIERIEVIAKDARTSAEEIDLILKNESDDSFWRQLGTPLLVECKNWSRKIGTDEVIIFKDKLDTAGTRVGILIAIKGITG